MEKLMIPEQDICNAVCVYIARERHVEPSEVEVELMYDDEEGFSAEAFVNGQKQVLTHLNLIQALRLWVDEILNRDPFAAGIVLHLDDEEGIVAAIR